MEILSAQEGRDAVKHVVEMEHRADAAISIRIDNIAAFYVLAGHIMRDMGTAGVILYIDEWGISPSSENWNLFDSLCRFHFGETHKVSPTKYAANEWETATTFLHLALEFGWGGILLSEDGNWFRFDHDGFGVLHCVPGLTNLGSIPGITLVR